MTGKRAAPAKSSGASDRSLAASEGASAEELARLASRSVPLARIVAGNASAAGALLEELSHHEDAGVRRKVAGNPATPAAAAIALGGQFPAELLGNPSFDIYLLEASHLLESLGIAALRSMLKRAGCPESLMAWASRQESEATQLAVLSNAAAPAGVVEVLAGSAHERVRAAARGHVALASRAPAEDWEEAFRRGIREEWEKTSKVHEAHRALACLIMEELEWKRLPEGADALAVATALDPSEVPSCDGIIASGLITDAEELAALARDPVPAIRAGVAKYPGTPAALLEQLAKDESSKVRGAVASHPSTPVALLEQLAKDEDIRVREAVAENPSTPVALLYQLLNDEDAKVRVIEDLPAAAVASNPSTPVALLEQLAKDKNYSVRWRVASNPSTPVALLEQLAKDEDIRVRLDVAENPSTPAPLRQALLEQLAKDENGWVRLNVAENPSTPAPLRQALLEQLAKDENGWVRLNVAENPSTPAPLRQALLEQLAKDENYLVCWRVAENPSTPVALLEQLAKDEDYSVRKAVAENPSTPVALLEQLAKDENGWVREAVAENPSTPVALLEQLADEDIRAGVAKNPSTPVALLEQLAKDEESDLRAAVAGNAASPVALLEQLAKDEDIRVRKAVAENPSTPREARLAVFSAIRLCEAYAGSSRVIDKDREADLLDFLYERAGATRTLGKRIVAAQKAGDMDVLRREFVDDMAAASKASLYRTMALLQPCCPAQTLARYQRSSWWIERVAIARHPDCPVAVLKALLADASPIVRAAASARAAAAERAGGRSAAHALEPALDWRQLFNEALLARDTSAIGRPEAGVARSHVNWLYMVWRLECFGRADLVGEADRLVLMHGSDARFTARFKRWLDHARSIALGRPLLAALLAKNSVISERIRLAHLRQLAKDESSEVRGAVASHPSTPVALLEQLAKDKSEWVRLDVAKNPSTPAPLRQALLEQLAKDKDIRVLLRVAENPSTPVALLEQLADEYIWVRAAVASHPSTPVALLEQLAKDEDIRVRWRVAENPSTPVALLEQLAKDEDIRVLLRVAENPSTPVALLEQLAKDEDIWVRAAVASHPSTPVALLEQLAKDECWEVRHAVALNPRTSEGTRRILLLDPVGGYGEIDAERSRQISAALENEGTLRELRAELLEALTAGRKPSHARAHALLQPDCPAATLSRCARSAFWLERCAVAQNPGTPEKIVRQLAEDPNPAVRAAAAERLAGMAASRSAP